jgi:hypothetical protein
MNFKIKTIIFLATTLAIFFAAGNQIVYAGFGVSPSSIINKTLVPGSFFTEDVVLVQSHPDFSLNVTATVDAGEMNSWIKIENGKTFVIPKGIQQFPMKVSVSIPSNVELKEYKGTIHIKTAAADKQAAGVSVALGANVAIDLGVTEIKVSDFSIQNFQIPDVVVGTPIKFLIKVKNDGNIDNGPTKAILTFFDQYHSKQLGQQEEVITEKVKSFQTSTVSVDFPNNFDLGSYWADVKIYSDDKVAADSKIFFNVVNQAAAKKEQAKGFVFSLPNFSAIPLWAYLLAAAVLVIVLLVIIIILILRSKEDNSKKIKVQQDDKNKT